SSLFKRLGILPVYGLYYYRTCLYIKKHFDSMEIQQCNNSRRMLFINTNLYRTTKGQHSINFRGKCLLNLLKTDLNNMTENEIKSECFNLSSQTFVFTP